MHFRHFLYFIEWIILFRFVQGDLEILAYSYEEKATTLFREFIYCYKHYHYNDVCNQYAKQNRYVPLKKKQATFRFLVRSKSRHILRRDITLATLAREWGQYVKLMAICINKSLLPII